MRRAQLGFGLLVGCVLLGLGIGMLFDRAGTGTVIGLGTGFILSALVAGLRK